MKYQLDKDKIQSFLIGKNNTYSYKRRNNVYVLPLPTRSIERAKFENGFSAVLSAVLRIIDGRLVEFKHEDFPIDSIISEGKFDSELTSDIFKSYLEKEFQSIAKAEVITVEHLKYIPLPDDKNEAKGQMAFIQFFYDVFVSEHKEELKSILSTLESQNILSDIISISLANSTTNTLKSNYRMLFPNLSELFVEDLKTLASNSKFFIENIEELFVHYCFIALSQIVLQTNKFTQFDSEHLHKIVFMLQTEKASKWRDGYKFGFQLLKDQINEFYTNEHLLDILGMNTFNNGKKNQYYHDYLQFFEDAGKEAEQEFIESIYDWINNFYNNYWPLIESYKYDNQTLDTAFRDLYKVISKNVNKELNSRYPKAFLTFVSRFYRKNGGSLGTILSLNMKQLLLLIAVSVGPKGSRIELNELWNQLERRGVSVDHITKDEIVKVLDKLNYLDKKSDSGDAQYVKSIL